MRVSSFVAC